MRIVPLIALSFLVVAPSVGASPSGLVGTASIDYTQVIDSGKAPNPLHANDNFGSAIAVDGDFGVVGAYTAEDASPTGGAAYTIVRGPDGRWQVEQTLVPPTSDPGAAFGSSVAISGDYVFVGAPEDDTLFQRSGAVHVFRRNPMTQLFEHHQKITSNEPLGSWMNYGRQLATSPGRVVVGALLTSSDCDAAKLEVLMLVGGQWQASEHVPAHPGGCAGFGDAFALDGDRIAVTSRNAVGIYARTGPQWNQMVFIDDIGSDFVGTAVALSGDSLVVADHNVPSESATGDVRMFGFDTTLQAWQQTQSWSGDLQYRHCGSALAIRMKRLVITCASGANAYSSPRGATYFLQRDVAYPGSWSSQAIFDGDEIQQTSGLFFARNSAVFASDHEVLVGDSWSERDAPKAGAIRTYEYLDESPPIAKGFITRGDSGYEEQFGYSVAQRGDWMFVGVIGDSEIADDAGRVDVYKLEGGSWSFMQSLLPEDGDETQYFGTSVAIGDGFAAVGGSGIRDPSGVRNGGVYIYTLSGNTWVRSAFLQPLIGLRARFGRSMAADGMRLAIGAPTYVFTGPATGHVFIYERGADATQWTLVKQISRTSEIPSRSFGYAIALHGDVLVGGDNRNGAWIYERNLGGMNAWGELQLLSIATVGLTSKYKVAVDDDSIAVGVVSMSADGGASGEVQIFRRDSSAWTLSQTIARPPSTGGIERFGTSVAMSRDWLIVGGSRLHQNPETLQIDLDHAYARYYRRHPDGQFAEYGDTSFDVPVASFPAAVESPIAIGNHAIAIGVPVMPGRGAPSAPYSGAVFVVPAQSLPVFIGGFE